MNEAPEKTGCETFRLKYDVINMPQRSTQRRNATRKPRLQILTHRAVRKFPRFPPTLPKALGTHHMCCHLTLLGLSQSKSSWSAKDRTGQAKAELDGGTCAVYPAPNWQLHGEKKQRFLRAKKPSHALFSGRVFSYIGSNKSQTEAHCDPVQIVRGGTNSG